MEHFMIYDAMIKKHSTFTEAIQEGKAMEAGFTMLTHFSQRYAKMPMLTEIEGEHFISVNNRVFQYYYSQAKKMLELPSTIWLSTGSI